MEEWFKGYKRNVIARERVKRVVRRMLWHMEEIGKAFEIDVICSFYGAGDTWL